MSISIDWGSAPVSPEPAAEFVIDWGVESHEPEPSAVERGKAAATSASRAVERQFTDPESQLRSGLRAAGTGIKSGFNFIKRRIAPEKLS